MYKYLDKFTLFFFFFTKINYNFIILVLILSFSKCFPTISQQQKKKKTKSIVYFINSFKNSIDIYFKFTGLKNKSYGSEVTQKKKILVSFTCLV